MNIEKIKFDDESVEKPKRGRPKIYATKEEYNKALYQRNKEKMKEYKIAHKEEIKEYNKKMREENPDKYKEYEIKNKENVIKNNKKLRDSYELIMKFCDQKYYNTLDVELKMELQNFMQTYQLKEISLS